MAKNWPKPEKFSNSSSASSSGSDLSTNWFSIYVAAALSFVGTVQFSLYFSSIWPYLQIIDRSINETQFGWVIAVYSVGQIISAPLFGYLSNRIHQVRMPLIIGLTLMFLGNISYLSLEIVSIPKLYVLLFCRFITGMGSGNVCLLRTYASTASTAKDRSRAIAFVTCGQALGATGGPAFQLLFTSIPYPGFALLGIPSLRFNIFTAPAYLACLMNIAGTFVLLGCFREHYAGLDEVSAESTTNEHEEEKISVVESNNNQKSKLPPYDLIACFVCYLSRFTQMFVQGNLETIGSPYAMMMFAWAEQKAVEVTSIAQGLVGGITFATYIVYISLKSSKELNYRLSCILSFVGLIAFHLITYSWPFLPNPVTTFNETHTSAYQGSASSPQPVGCNSTKFSWCTDLAQVNVWLYYCSYVICIGLAFPVLNIAMNTLFSHILGPRRQGTQQGFFQMSGSIARMLGPILMSTLYSLYGPNMAWIMELVVAGTTLTLWLIFYGRMIPLLSKNENNKKRDRRHSDTLSTVTALSHLELIKGAAPADGAEKNNKANNVKNNNKNNNNNNNNENGNNNTLNIANTTTPRRQTLSNTLSVVYERDGKLSVAH